MKTPTEKPMTNLANINFWDRLENFMSNVQVNDAMSEEERQMIIHVCNEQQQLSQARAEYSEMSLDSKSELKKYLIEFCNTAFLPTYQPINAASIVHDYLDKNICNLLPPTLTKEQAVEMLPDYKEIYIKSNDYTIIGSKYDFEMGAKYMRQKAIEAISRIGVESKSDASEEHF